MNEIESKLKKFDIVKKGNEYDIDIKIGSALGFALDAAQEQLEAQMWDDIQKYMPHDSGALISETNSINQSTRGEVYFFPPNSDYGHYQYMGTVYVDPLYKVAGWQDEEGNWFSRRGITKVPSERKLKYKNPNARARWGEYAIEQHSDEWMDVVERAIKW